MSTQKLITIVAQPASRMAAVALIAIMLFTMFIISYDQGHLFSVVQGQEAFDGLWIHEFSHDMRHAAGFPCH
jgi:hypothetical protein